MRTGWRPNWRTNFQDFSAAVSKSRIPVRRSCDSAEEPMEERSQMSAVARTDRSRWLALYVLCVGMLMIVLDVTIVNVALPSMQQDLKFSQSDLAWVMNAYMIAFGGLLLLAGRLGDLIGQRRVFLVGLTVFTLASVACA